MGIKGCKERLTVLLSSCYRPGFIGLGEDLGTIEIPCGKVDCRANCLEYLVRSARKREDYALAECKISPLVSII